MNLLTVQELTKEFGGLRAVHDLSFEVARGEIVGLIGPNGSGKTTTFNLLTGFLPPTAGTVTFDGHALNNRKPHEICALGLTRTFQIVQPFPDITVLENVLIGAFGRYPSASAATSKAKEVLGRVGLGHKADALGKNLTLEELKRLEIGKALATEPKMLLLDEVASGLNEVEVEEMLTLIRDLNKQGITFLMVEHIMQVIMNLCQCIVCLNFGQKISEGTPAQISCDPQVLAAYLGEEASDA